MKLTDFKTFAPLNALKDRMGIPRGTFGELRVEIAPGRLTPADLKKLRSPEGIVVSFDDLIVLPDGTLGVKGQRVVLYIRDISSYGGKFSEPRFHLANCSTLQYMREDRRFERYVANNGDTGEFKINLVNSGSVQPMTRRLRVCQNCLEFLKYGNFSLSQPRSKREQAVSSFSLPDFFGKYPRSFHAEFPKYDSVTAPINDYTPDFAAISDEVRKRADWRCANPACSVYLPRAHLAKYLHVHHINGLKHDNSPGNLKALCLYCHAEEPAHKHLKSLDEYRIFAAIRARLVASKQE